MRADVSGWPKVSCRLLGVERCSTPVGGLSWRVFPQSEDVGAVK